MPSLDPVEENDKRSNGGMDRRIFPHPRKREGEVKPGDLVHHVVLHLEHPEPGVAVSAYVADGNYKC